MQQRETLRHVTRGAGDMLGREISESDLADVPSGLGLSGEKRRHAGPTIAHRPTPRLVLIDIYSDMPIDCGMALSAMAERTCIFVGSSRRDLSDMPDGVKVRFGHDLHMVQQGKEPSSAKALKGFGGRGVLELIEDHDGSTYRAVYTVRFAEAVYVLHAFQKKSKSGIATPKHVIDMVASRLKDAEAMHRAAMKAGE